MKGASRWGCAAFFAGVLAAPAAGAGEMVLRAEPMEGPFASLDRYCRQAVGDGRLRCDPKTCTEFPGAVAVGAPFKEIDLCTGSTGAYVAARTERGWYAKHVRSNYFSDEDQEGQSAAPMSWKAIAGGSAAVLGVSMDDEEASTGTSHSLRAEQLLFLGLGRSGVPSVTPPLTTNFRVFWNAEGLDERASVTWAVAEDGSLVLSNARFSHECRDTGWQTKEDCEGDFHSRPADTLADEIGRYRLVFP